MKYSRRVLHSLTTAPTPQPSRSGPRDMAAKAVAAGGSSHLDLYLNSQWGCHGAMIVRVVGGGIAWRLFTLRWLEQLERLALRLEHAHMEPELGGLNLPLVCDTSHSLMKVPGASPHETVCHSMVELAHPSEAALKLAMRLTKMVLLARSHGYAACGVIASVEHNPTELNGDADECSSETVLRVVLALRIPGASGVIDKGERGQLLSDDAPGKSEIFIADLCQV